MGVQQVFEPGANRSVKAGFSLTELLVASTIALAVMGAVASLFSTLGSASRSAEAIVAMTDGLRTAAARLREDLTGVTPDLSRVGSPVAAMGYFEYIEGARRDYNVAYSAGTPAGDTDDVLLFTTRALGKPFAGRFTAVVGGTNVSASFESPYAEVAWFCKASPDVEQTAPRLRLHRLYRRQLLTTAYVGSPPFVTPGAPNVLNQSALTSSLTTLYANYDLSLRRIGSLVYAPNSLADLTRRENRFLRNAGFPYNFLGADSDGATFDGTLREGEDVVLANVIGFDVRAFDPEAVIRRASTSNLILQPGDPGYDSTGATQQSVATGAFVDLGWGAQVNVSGSTLESMVVAVTRNPVAMTGQFPPTGQTPFQSDGVRVANSLSGGLREATYDTWSTHYEFNGLDEDGDGVADEGANGVDDNSNGFPDDFGEYETSPPYPVPLRGIEVRIRCYEPTSKQIRQITVRHTFVKK
jgi:hypothetical protein